MKYDLDLSKMDIKTYQIFLKNQYLIPSRQILHEDLDKNFKIFADYGLNTLLDLKKAISTKEKLKKISSDTTISLEYLTILKRELGTFDKKVFSFENFPIIDSDITLKLAKKEIKNTKDFYEYYYKLNNEEKLSKELDIPIEIINCLISLSSLVRINGIGVLAATTFYEAGYVSIENIINSTKEDILEKVTKINNEKEYYKAKLGLKDMQFVIDFANLLKYFD